MDIYGYVLFKLNFTFYFPVCYTKKCLVRGRTQDSCFFVSGYPVSVSGVITVPVSASMYQTMVANIQSDGTMQVVTPMVQVPKVEPGNGETSIEAVTIQGHPMTMINAAGEHQVLQVISLKDANVLTKAMQAEVVKDEDSQQQQTVSSPE